MIMEIGASPAWTNNFDSENEMISVVFRLLAKREPPPDLRRVLNQITNGSGYYFFDLDLTSEEAESLGYPHAPPIPTSQGIEHSTVFNSIRTDCKVSLENERYPEIEKGPSPSPRVDGPLSCG
jgi:hypothetical protein